MSVDDFKEVIKEVVLSVVSPINNSTEIKMKKEEKKFFTREETKNLLDVSFTTLWKYNKEGILPATRIGSRIYYKMDDIIKSMIPIHTKSEKN